MPASHVRTFGLVLMLLAGGLPGGCMTLALAPLGTRETIVARDELIGEWALEGDDVRIEIARSEERAPSYIATVVAISNQPEQRTDEPGPGAESQDPMEFRVSFVQLGDHLFTDVSSAEPRMQRAMEAGIIGVPARVLAKVVIEGDAVRLWLLDTGWLLELLREDPGAIGCVRLDSTGPVPFEARRPFLDVHLIMLLTAPTDDLAKFIEEHADNPDAWYPEPLALRRTSKPGGAEHEERREAPPAADDP